MKRNCIFVRVIYLLCGLFWFSNSVFALDVTDPIFLDKTWSLADSPINVLNDIVVNSSAVLTIDAGVMVKFNDNVALTISDGSLIARGTSQALITFTSNDPTKIWRHIKFETAAVDAAYDVGTGDYVSGSIIEYAVIEKAGNQVNSPSGAIQLFNSHPFLNNLVIRNNNASGIFSESTSLKLVILDSVISSNSDSSGLGGGGVLLKGIANSEVILRGNTIKNNSTTTDGGGVNTTQIDVVTIQDNIISGNQSARNGGGISSIGLQNVIVSMISGNLINNNIAVNLGGGIYVNSVGTALTVFNNRIIDNDADQGGGMCIAFNASSQEVSILKNMFIGNHAASSGGSFNIENGNHSILNNVFYSNTSDQHAAGLDIHAGVSTVSNNIIAANISNVQPLNLPGVGEFNSNSVVGNVMTEPDGIAEAIFFRDIPTATGNLFAYNETVQKNLISFFIVSAVVAPNFSGNSFIGNVSGFLLANALSTTVLATNNWWETIIPSEISSFLIGTSIDSSSPATAPLEDVPVSPPKDVAVVSGASEINVSWSANPEMVSGYIVYWGDESAPNYTESQDVGNVTSFDIPSLSPGSYFVAVTAYDDGIVIDDMNTFINERQTAGNESWFSSEKQATLVGTDLALTIEASANAVNVTEAVTFTVTVTNNGPVTANNVVVRAAIPTGASYVSGTTGCASSAGIVTCSIDALASVTPDNVASFSVTFNAPDTAGTLNLSASVSASEFDVNTVNDTVSIDTIVNAVRSGGGGIFSPWFLLLIIFLNLARKQYDFMIKKYGDA